MHIVCRPVQMHTWFIKKKKIKACQYRYPVAPGFCLVSNNQKLVSTGILRVTKKKDFWFFNNLSATSSFSVHEAYYFFLLAFSMLRSHHHHYNHHRFDCFASCVSPKNCLGEEEEEEKRKPWGETFLVICYCDSFEWISNGIVVFLFLLCVPYMYMYPHVCVYRLYILVSINTWTSHRNSCFKTLFAGLLLFRSFFFFSWRFFRKQW